MSVHRPRPQTCLRSEKSIPSQDDRLPYIYIVPKIVESDEEQAEHRNDSHSNLHVERDDKNQHFFTDQVKFTRPAWERPWFCCVTMAIVAVDKSAVGTFPATVANNGGLAFMIVYLLAHTFITFPLMYMEGILGQYFQVSMIGVWGICPIFKSITSGLYLIAFMFATFNPAVFIWAFYMLVECLLTIQSGSLSWASCNNPWNSCICDGARNPECAGQPIPNGTKLRDPTDEYFVGAILKLWKTKYADPREILSVTENANPNKTYGFQNEEEGVGSIRHTYAGVLAAVSLIILAINSSRYRVAGNIYTFTIIFPLIVMTLLICRGTTLDGGLRGVLTYLHMDFRDFFSLQIWIIAAQSAVYSMGLGLGLHLTIASFNPIHHPLARDVILALLLDTVTNCMGCVVSYSFLGNLYQRNGKEIPKKYPGQGLLLPFTLFPHAVSGIAGSSFFASLYYLMIVLMAADSCVIFHQVLTYSLYEEYRRKYPDQKVSGITFRCITLGFSLIFGLISVTRGGYWFVVYADTFFYTLSWTLYPMLEVVAICWIWGLEELCHATEVISRKRPSLYLRLCWKFIVPTFLCLLLHKIFTTLSFEPISEMGVTAPPSTRYFAAFLTFFTPGLLLCELGFKTLLMCRKASGFCTALMLLLSPEYEHDQIKLDFRRAKRLHLRHYLFLRFPDEVDDSTPFYKIPLRMCARLKLCCSKKNAVGPGEGSGPDQGPEGNQDGEHTHRHHYHGYKKLSDNVRGMWDKIQKRFSKQPAEDTLMPAPPPPHPELESGTTPTPTDITTPTRIDPVDKEQPPPTPPSQLPASKVRSRTELAQSQSNTSLASTGSRGQRAMWKN